MKTPLFVFLLLLFFSPALLAQHQVIPAPVEYKAMNGAFEITPATTIVLGDKAERRTAVYLQDYLLKYHKLNLQITTAKQQQSNVIRLNTRRFIQPPANPEGYTLSVDERQVVLEGDSYAGTFYAMQTLLQLLPVKEQSKLLVPFVQVNDFPRFGYRGMHLDVSRHFFPISYVKRYIDYLALHKLNTFHWHLTDDQGWRIEIKKYPRLTSVGAYRNGTIIGRYPGTGNDSLHYGGYYTQQEIKEVVQYAADRFITVIPEIDVPGHSSASIAAYPYLSCYPGESTKWPAGTAWAGTTKGKQVQQAWGIFPDVLCAGKETTFTFLEDVLSELIELFPSQTIHIGGDENEKDQWRRCPNCQRRMKQNNLKDENQLQAYFFKRLAGYLNGKGRQVIGWNEILQGGLPPGAVVMSWQGEKSGIEAARLGHKAIMSTESHLYLNFSQSRNEDSVSFGRFTPIEKVYSYEPLPKVLRPEQAKNIIGVQAQLWAEYIKNTSILEYNLFPRLSAVSEVAWSSRKDWSDFEQRLMVQMSRYNKWGINFSKALFEINFSIKPSVTGEGVCLSFDDYKYKKSLRLLKDTTPYELVVFNPSTQTKEYQRHRWIEQPIHESACLTQSGVYRLFTDTVSGNSETAAPPFAYTTDLHLNINKATGKKIELKDQPSGTYPGKGAFGLINGLKAKDFNSKEWLGFSGKKLDAVIDLGKVNTIERVVLNTWRQEPSWVYLPVQLDISTSTDGVQWKTAMSKPKNKTWQMKNNRSLSFSLSTPAKARYVRVVAHNYGKIPAGRAGAGRQAWLFADEIEIY